MNWEDEGFLLYKNKFNENSVITEIFTLNHGKCTGIIYGGTSKKIKNYLQLGNLIYVNFKSKNENRLGYFKVEIIDPIAPLFYEDKKKIRCLLSSLNLLKLVLPEFQKNKTIFDDFTNFITTLKFSDKWIIDYIFWEIKLLKELGFDMNLDIHFKDGNKKNNDLIKIELDGENRDIPYFLIEKKSDEIKNSSIKLALSIIRNYFEKKVFFPNNLTYPLLRKNFETFFK